MIIAKVLLLLALSMAEQCPESCTCNMDTVSCPDLIDSCAQCAHWPRIEFSQITSLGPYAFKNFLFNPHRHYSLIIYKLMNSSIGPDTFNQLSVGPGASLKIIFQYNSFVEFKANSLSGLVLGPNSTLTFNFPYTTQVKICLACLNGIKFDQSKLIFKIYKSFSVSFIVGQLVELDNAQVLFDINSTQLVKFEENSLHAHISNSSLSFDLKSIEKCIIKKNFFQHSNLSAQTKILFHLKQIIFLDINPFSFNRIKLIASNIKIYLVELVSSFCVQPNSLSQISLQLNSSLNLSIVQSKNVQFMTNSVNRIDSKQSSVFIGVLDSVLNDNDVKTLLITQPNQEPSFYNHQYFYSKQKYTYNLSVARNAFSFLNTDKLVIMADNLDTVYFDDFFVSGSQWVTILLNVKNVAIGEQKVANGKLDYMNEPNVVRLKGGFAGLGQVSYRDKNCSFVKQWENCIEENLDYESSGEVSNVLSHMHHDYDLNSTSIVSKSSVKITGLFIIGLVLLILFLVLIVNLVQYKYKEDSFDDLDSSTQNANVGENLLKCENREADMKEKTVQAESLADTKTNE